MRKSDAVAHFGTQAGMARALRRSQPWVSQLPEELPVDVQIEIYRVTGGALLPDRNTRRVLDEHAELARQLRGRRGTRQPAGA